MARLLLSQHRKVRFDLIESASTTYSIQSCLTVKDECSEFTNSQNSLRMHKQCVYQTPFLSHVYEKSWLIIHMNAILLLSCSAPALARQGGGT